MSTNVLVTGATGLLGRQIFNTFKHSGCLVVGQGFSRAAPPTILKADLENPEEIKNLLDEAKYVYLVYWISLTYLLTKLNRPQVVIHCTSILLS